MFHIECTLSSVSYIDVLPRVHVCCAQLRHYQYFVASEWTGGIYLSPSMPGSRPGGLIASTWAALVSMGYNGYLNCARDIMNAAKQIEQGIRQMDGLKVLGKPHMSVISFSTDPTSAKGRQLNIYKIGESMGQKGWILNTLQKPGAIHICCTYLHRDQWQRFLNDLKDAVQDVFQVSILLSCRLVLFSLCAHMCIICMYV